MQKENVIYTPTPKTLDVVIYTDERGETKAESGDVPNHLIRGDIIRRETATVIGRGNLLSNGRERWHQVQLADGSRHSVIGEGS